MRRPVRLGYSARQTWKVSGNSYLPNAPRRLAPPLDITSLPGYDKLNSREKELCSHLRPVPCAYIDFKVALISECEKHGGLRLAQARQLIKIDVNKTRKIYDPVGITRFH